MERVNISKSHQKAGQDNRMWAMSAYKEAKLLGLVKVDFEKTSDGHLQAFGFKGP